MNAVLQSVQQIGSGRVIALSVLALSLLIGFAFLSMRLSEPVFSPLYSNLTSEDSGSIVTELGAMGVKFSVANRGSSIMVPSSDVLPVRMALAQKGLPSHGSIVGYEIFDKESALGTSTFVLNVNILRALEGELSRTISSLGSVKSARVHLVIPKRELFRKSKIQPSASVIIKLHDRTLSPKKEIASIKHLVSSAVPSLSPRRITIVDGNGNLLSRGSGSDEMESMSASTSVEYRSNYENRLQRKIETLLEEAVGTDRVKVRVTAEMKFDRITTSSEAYDPDGKVARSVQTSEEVSSNADKGGGSVSASNNLPGGNAGGGSGSSASSNRTNELTNFEISKTLTNTISNVGEVTKLSVAVLVDGTYTKIVDEDTEEVTETYVPRSDEEIEKLKALVSSITAIDAERGDVLKIINMRFNRDFETLIAEEGPFDWLKRDLDSIIKTFMVGIVAILGILLVIRPLVNKAFEISPADIEAEVAQASMQGQAMPEIPMGGGGAPMAIAGGADMTSSAINMDTIQSKVDTTPVKRVSDLVENNPEETLSVIRTWMSNNG